MIKLLAKSILIIVLSSFSSISIATNLPNHYPSAFAWTGMIEEISGNTIIISDREFNLNNFSVHRLNSFNSSVSDLKEGMLIGCVLSGNNILSVWELPKSLSSKSGTDLARGIN